MDQIVKLSYSAGLGGGGMHVGPCDPIFDRRRPFPGQGRLPEGQFPGPGRLPEGPFPGARYDPIGPEGMQV